VPVKNPATTALLLIDVQKEYILKGRPLFITDAPKVIDRLAKALVLWHRHGWPVAHIHHEEAEGSPLFAKGSAAQQPHRALVIRPTDGMIVKSRPGAFYGTDLEKWLRGKNVDAVLIGGFMTHLCCDSTAREAAARGFQVYFPSDGSSSPPLSDRGFGVISSAQIKAQVLTVMHSYATVAPLEQLLPPDDGAGETPAAAG
jgi:nicotinamidase-related amidase